MNGKLSTHVLDNYDGKPAADIPWTLQFYEPSSGWKTLASGKTNSDGRTDYPLLLGEALVSGKYKLNFEIGPYYLDKIPELPEPPFLDKVAIEVNLLAGENYHVPLLMTPWSYSTYRGS